MPVPSPLPGRREELARARGIFIVDGHRSPNRTGFCDVTLKSNEVGMRDNSVSYINSEPVSGIAGSSLRYEEEVPGAVVRRAAVCCRCHGNEVACCRD